MTDNSKRSYHSFDPSSGYPAGSALFYECLKCGVTVPSLPKESTHCRCRNIMIDAEYGRIKIRDHTRVRLSSVGAT